MLHIDPLMQYSANAMLTHLCRNFNVEKREAFLTSTILNNHVNHDSAREVLTLQCVFCHSSYFIRIGWLRYSKTWRKIWSDLISGCTGSHLLQQKSCLFMFGPFQRPNLQNRFLTYHSARVIFLYKPGWLHLKRRLKFSGLHEAKC